MVITTRALLLATVAISGNLLADENIFVNTDVFELEVAANPQISPGGSRIAYTRRSMDIMTDRAVSNIWIVDADGDNHRPLLSGAKSYSGQRWSPNGDRLAYVTDEPGRGAQVHVRWMDSGQTAVLTNLRESPSALYWSPDGKTIAFSMFVERDGPSLASPPKKPEGAEWAPPAKVIESVRYRADGRGYLEIGDRHIFVVSAEGGTPRQLTSGEYNHGGQLAWTPDGKAIVFAANRQEDWIYDPMEAELWSVDVASGELTQLTDRIGPDTGPVISPDGSKLAYLGFDDKKMGYHSNQVYVMDRRSGSIDILGEELDRQIDDVQWAGSSSRLYIQYEDQGDTLIATLTLNGKIGNVARDVGGVGLGRPYSSGSF
jgi:Tol biopolymer transport system component